MDPISVFDIRLVTAQRQDTAVQKIHTPLKKLSLHYNLGKIDRFVKRIMLFVKFTPVKVYPLCSDLE